MGIRVDHRKAQIPPPTKLLIDAMAQHMHNAAVDRVPSFNPAGWANADMDIVGDWEFLAKVAYGVMAVHGGATKVEL